jgi:hypothetical protein
MNAAHGAAYDRFMRPIRVLLAVLAVALLGLSTTALAKEYAPPGRAGTSEYAEDIPSAGGNTKTPAMGGGNSTAAQIDKLGAGRAGVRKLTKLGPSGAATAEFAQQTAPTRTASSATSSRKRTTGPSRSRTTTSTTVGSTRSLATAGSPTTLDAGGGSALSALGRMIGGSQGGIGLFLPLLLVLCAIVAVAAALVRTRRPASDAPRS